jgi:hypothetical protein
MMTPRRSGLVAPAARLSGRSQAKESVMVRSARILLLLVVLGGTAATAARAQAPAAPDDAALPALPAPAPVVPTPTFAPVHLPGPYFEPDRLLDRPPLPPPGWFADAELGVVIPHVKNHLNGLVSLSGSASADTVALPSAPLDWAAFPRLEAGYRLPSGFGAFALSYRFLDTTGNGTIAGLDGGAALHSRLSLNEMGLDYSSDETSLWPNWDMKWSAGLRLLYVFFDSRADGPAAGGTTFEQHESNWYGGFGPHVGLELDRQITDMGLSLVLRGGGGLYLGRLRQGFFEQAGAVGAGGTNESVSQAVPSLATFVGVRWQPPGWEDVNFYFGYQYEHWWSIGKNNNTLSSGELNVQGIFARAEINF